MRRIDHLFLGIEDLLFPDIGNSRRKLLCKPWRFHPILYKQTCSASFLLEISSGVRSLYLWQRSIGRYNNFLAPALDWEKIMLAMFATKLDALCFDNLMNSEQAVSTLLDVRFAVKSVFQRQIDCHLESRNGRKADMVRNET